MKILRNQTLYQCEFCHKRLLSRKGAKLHENNYCRHPDSLSQIAIKEKQNSCPHINTETQYSYIHGEAVKEPAYELCLDCGAHG